MMRRCGRFAPWIATGSALVAALVAFYRRPFATVRAALRAWMRLLGASERSFDVYGVPVRAFTRGPKDGEALVLIHGLADSAESWAQLLTFLPRDRRIIVPDLAGFGRVPIPPEGRRFSALHKYLVGLLDALGVGRAILVGNSLGGALAIRLAATQPDRVARLILLDSVIGIGATPGYFAPTTRAFARELAEVSTGPIRFLPGFVLDDLIRRARHPARRAFLASPEPTDVAADLARVVAPTTIVWGALDRLVPLSVGERLRDAIPGAELLVLPRAGHVPQTAAPRAVAAMTCARLGPLCR